MGGRIEYQPRRGGGSVFRFDVRLKRDAEFERLADVIEEARGRRVMLVDANPVRRASFGEQVQGWGIKVRVLADGVAAALVLAQDPGWDLLLVHQDAPEAAQALAAVGPAIRSAVLVPLGMVPRLALSAKPEAVLWLSAPIRRRTLIDAALGRVLPSVDAPEIAQPQQSDVRARVLVVEDSDANRLVLTARLERMGCSVDGVATGSEAVRLVSQRRYGLVLSDLSLPDMSGLEVAAAIRQLGGDAGRVPIVAVTGGTHPRDRERCLAAGMNDFLSKPLEQRDLIRVLERYVPRAQEAAPVWDPAEIERLAHDLGGERAVELLAAFERELGQRLARMGEDVALDRVGREAHALKSAGLTFGASSLGEIARTLEKLCRDGAVAEARKTAQELLVIGRAVQLAVRRWIDLNRGSER
jgi:CheY-like chemotaxis protein/HPt (histidine-containing phosphotransfer) domain-containing protein